MSPFSSHPDELISASVTGDLTDVERRQLEAHLAGCEQCRATLAAFREQRQLLAGMAQPPAPRDLGARVGEGIERGRFAAPWWRRPGAFLAGGASLATVAAAALLVLFFVNQTSGPNVGERTSSPSPSPTATATATPSASPSPAASAQPTATPVTPVPLPMEPGDLLYTRVSGTYDNLKLELINAQAGASTTIANPPGAQYGAIDRAALSPDGQLLAFATETGLKGTLRIFVTDLLTGSTQQLAETLPVAFGERLAWSPDGRYLAFTAANLGDASQPSDVWLYDRVANQARQLTNQGNAIFASWAPVSPGNNEQLWVSLLASTPVSDLVGFPVDGGIPAGDPLDGKTTAISGAFAPLVAPDGGHVLYWVGTFYTDMYGDRALKGAMPQMATYDPSASSWSGTPLFSDLSVQPGGAAFSYGELTWAADSDAFAFWSGQWTGTPEGTSYPDINAIYFGRVSTGPLSQSSALRIGSLSSSGGDMNVMDVELAPDGGNAAVTLRVPLVGDLSAPQSYLRVVPTDGSGTPTDVGSGGSSSPPWSGPGIFIPATIAP